MMQKRSFIVLTASAIAIVAAASLSNREQENSVAPAENVRMVTPSFDVGGIQQLAGRKILQSVQVPNGRYAALAIDDGWNLDCYLVEVAAKQVVFSFSGPMKGQYFAQISPQESFLASTRIFQRSIVLFDIQTGEVVREFSGHKSMIRQIEFSSDERFMASIDMDGGLRLWNVRSSEEVAEPIPEIDRVEAIRFRGNDTLTVTANGITRTISLSGV